MEGIKSFDELLAKHGQGYGCEVCKPTVGSLLASCWNEYVLKPQHTPLQDTNDNFLGNIQKDGTYSVIPRSAGGEITPEGLMAPGPNRAGIQPLHQNHRLPAYRPVWRAEGRPAGNLASADCRRL